ncbi:MAG: TIGR02281 family clan AA aspartic protease [Pseudomonas sp.]
MSKQTAGQRAGRVMWVLFWGAGLALATHFFGIWEDKKHNPNQVPMSSHGQGFIEVRLASNGQGHFMSTGAINGTTVLFMLDTGATDVAIPASVADSLKLQRGAPVTLSTANGMSNGYRTQIDSLQVGEIVLHNVRGIVAPGMHGDEVLLGMSALKQLEFTQRDGTLVLRQTTTQ